MSKINSPDYQYRSWRTMGIERQEIESFCRQVLALCDSEFHEERQRLQLEQAAIVERRKREAVMERGIDEAPGVILECLCYAGITVWCEVHSKL